MIKRVEAKNYRCLEYISIELSAFQILIGANASGKTTFFDVLGFLKDIVTEKNVKDALAKRITKNGNFEDITFCKKGGDIEFAIELELPESIRKTMWKDGIDTIRYEIKLGRIGDTQEIGIKEEKVILFDSKKNIVKTQQSDLFPAEKFFTESILNKKYKQGSSRQILRKNDKKDYLSVETEKKTGKGWMLSFNLGHTISTLGTVVEDTKKFPATVWLKKYLAENVKFFILDSLNMRVSVSPETNQTFQPDGSNLPWAIKSLKEKYPKKFKRWVQHLQTALPDIKDVDTKEIAYNKHLYLEIIYNNEIVVPSWLLSDGTLRILALTLPAYLPELAGLFLIEEPENGIHPKAIHMVFQSLSSVYNSQIFVATHSALILGLAKPEQILCFAKTSKGATDIVRGNDHPNLTNWNGSVDLSTLYAGGILG